MISERGFVLFISYNKFIDYILLAKICAEHIKKNLVNNNITAIIDEKAYKKMDLDTKKLFDNIIVHEDIIHNNIRDKKIPFNNMNRNDVYSLSPYKETIVLDTDYLVQSNFLDSIWNNTEDFLISDSAIDANLQQYKDNDDRLNPKGINMFWATIIYFKKTEKNEVLFNLVKYIQENYIFYKFIYKFPGITFRNDYAFSIAIHILGGFIDSKIAFGNKYITSKPQDEVVQINNNNLIILINDISHPWKYIVSNIDKIDIHILNKNSLLSVYKKGNK